MRAVRYAPGIMRAKLVLELAGVDFRTCLACGRLLYPAAQAGIRCQLKEGEHGSTKIPVARY